MAHYEPWQQCKFNVFFQRKCVFEWELFEKRNEDRRDVLVDREVELGRDGVGNIEIARYSETLALHFSAAVTATRTRNGASKVCSTGLAPMFLSSPRLRKHSRLKTGFHCCIVWTRQNRLIWYIFVTVFPEFWETRHILMSPLQIPWSLLGGRDLISFLLSYQNPSGRQPRRTPIW